MNLKNTVIIILASIIGFSSYSQNQSPTKKAIFILIDGVSSDAIEAVSTPYLDAISKEGAYARAFVGGLKRTYSQTPTVSAPGYNNLITGTWANKHNVWGNSIKDPNYNYWNIFRIVENHNPNLKTAIFSTWLDNRTKLVGEGLENAGAIKFDYAFDGFEHDTINFPHKKDETHFLEIDEFVTDETARYIIESGPDLSWVYLEFTDNMGHMYGDSPQFHDAIKKADNQVGRIWDALQKRSKEFNEDWMIVVTTDHGRSADTGMGHGGQSDRERATWIVTNQKTNDYFKETPGIIDIIPSILNHMEIEIPLEIEKEIDGTSFINSIAMSNLTASKQEGKLQLKWKSYGVNQKAKVFLTTTNNFKDGGQDKYSMAIEVNTQEEKATITIEEFPSEYYKIVLESETNTLNTWVVK
jgi:predicted AlkP superfamily pyrophosphatase or phosphodiesterase